VRRIDAAERVLTILTIVAGVLVLILVLLLTGCAGKKPVEPKIPETPPAKFHVTLRGAVNGQCHVAATLTDAKDPNGQIWVCKEGLR
jgi:hypothetical protein